MQIKSQAKPQTIKFKNYKNKNIDLLKNDITTSFSSVSSDDNVDELVLHFNTSLSRIHDEHFPTIEKTIFVKEDNPWFDADIAKLKTERRKAERA